MRKIYSLISILLMISSCTSCFLEVNIIGKYYSQKEGIENYLEIKKNGEFTHYYSNGKLNLKHSGTWKKNEKGYCSLEFNEWKNFETKGDKYEILGNQILFINGKYLDHSPDGSSPSSFVKKEK